MSFYASCEQVYRVEIRNLPILVFSNNDSICVTLNDRAKQLGFEKFRTYQDLAPMIKLHGAVCFSSNYSLYADLSRRMMETLKPFASDFFIYSIDEAWLEFSGHEDLRETGREINRTVFKHTGIPTRTGFGSNKTLAKVASSIAKRIPRANGVCCIDDDFNQRPAILDRFPIGEVWGIGSKTESKLKYMGINTALELADYDKKNLRKLFGVTIERTARELNGEKCLSFHEVFKEQQQIISSKAFGKPIYQLPALLSVTMGYLEKAMEKLRANNQLARYISISASGPRSSGGRGTIQEVIALPTHTNDTLLCAQLVTTAFTRIFKPNKYLRSMVCLTGLISDENYQLDFLEPEQSIKSRKLMSVIDTLNKGNQKNVSLGRSPKQTPWSMRRELLSPRYTTSWTDLPTIQCK